MRPFLLLAAALALPLVAATHQPVGRCDADGAPSLGLVMITTGVPGGSQLHGPNPDGVFYVDDRNQVLGNGIHFYEESNGIYVRGEPHRSLQRGGGASPFFPDDAELCVDDPNVLPDTRIL